MTQTPQTPATTDPVIQKFREEITALDAQLVTVVNKRLAAVEKLRRYKAQRGIPFRDPAREEWMLQYLTRFNPGPLSNEGFAELYAFVLDLIKREVGDE
jgi:chorismate mutase